MDAYDIFHKKDLVWDSMYKQPGSVYKVYEWCAKQCVNASGEKPVFIKVEPQLSKIKRIN